MSDSFHFDDQPDRPDDDGEDMPLPDWLNQEGDFGDDDEAAADAPSPPPEADDELLPDWLAEGEGGFEETPADEDMSYEEWMAAQSGEAPKEPDLTEEVPDWLAQDQENAAEELPSVADLTGDAAGEGPDDGFVPDWYMGLEEQDLDEAPDWVKDAGSGSVDAETLLDTSSLEEAPPPPPPAPSDAEPDDVPDWFADSDTIAATDEEPDWFAGTGQAPTIEPEEQAELPDLDFSGPLAEEVEEVAPPPMAEDVAPDEAFEDELPGLDLGGDLDADELDWGDVEDDLAPAEADFLDDWDEEPAPAEADFLDDWGDEPAAAEADLLGDWDEKTAPTAEDDLAPADVPDWLAGAPPDDAAQETVSDDVAGLDFELEGLSETDFDPADLDDMGDLDELLGEDAPRRTKGQTERLIAEMQTSGLDIGALLGDEEEADQELTGSGELVMPDDRVMKGTSTLFEDVDDSLFVPGEQAEGQAEAPALSEEDALDLLTFEDALALADEEEAAAEGPAAAGLRPDWVADLRPDVPVTLKSGNLGFEFEQARLADMPEELRTLRERAAALSIMAEEEEEEERAGTGPLAGISGGLQQATLVESAEPDFQLGSGVRVTESQQHQIAILESALALTRSEQEAFREGRAAAPPAEPDIQPRRRSRLKVDRLLVSILLLVVLVAPFASDALHAAFLTAPDDQALGGQQAAVVQAVDELQPGDRVLLAFEYGPTVAGEMNPLAEAVLRDLFKQGAVPLTTSTTPLGVLNARQVMNDLDDDETLLAALGREAALSSGEDYFLLRYIAADDVGVRALTRSATLGNLLFDVDSRGEATGLDIGTVGAGDLALVIVLGESLEDARRWAEQFPVEGLPKYLLTTAAAEPLVRVYVGREAAFRGYLVGYRDTYLYNRARHPEAVQPAPNLDDYNLPDTDTAQWYSQWLGVLAAAGLIVLGALFNFVRRIGRRRA